jgi:hypothetical protein
VDVLIKSIGNTLPDGIWLEPCAGHGEVIKQVARSGYTPSGGWHAYEIDEKCRHSLKLLDQDLLNCTHCPEDFLSANIDTHYACVITNPPYSLAFDFVEKALSMADTVVMLLRLNWLGSVERHTLHTRYNPDLYILTPRPSFTGNRNDSTEYAWFVWSKLSAGRWKMLPIGPTKKQPRKLASIDKDRLGPFTQEGIA